MQAPSTRRRPPAAIRAVESLAIIGPVVHRRGAASLRDDSRSICQPCETNPMAIWGGCSDCVSCLVGPGSCQECETNPMLKWAALSECKEDSGGIRRAARRRNEPSVKMGKICGGYKVVPGCSMPRLIDETKPTLPEWQSCPLAGLPKKKRERTQSCRNGSRSSGTWAWKRANEATGLEMGPGDAGARKSSKRTQPASMEGPRLPVFSPRSRGHGRPAGPGRALDRCRADRRSGAGHPHPGATWGQAVSGGWPSKDRLGPGRGGRIGSCGMESPDIRPAACGRVREAPRGRDCQGAVRSGSLASSVARRNRGGRAGP